MKKQGGMDMRIYEMEEERRTEELTEVWERSVMTVAHKETLQNL